MSKAMPNDGLLEEAPETAETLWSAREASDARGSSDRSMRDRASMIVVECWAAGMVATHAPPCPHISVSTLLQ